MVKDRMKMLRATILTFLVSVAFGTGTQAQADLAPLFAPPSNEEIAAVLEEWTEPRPVATGWRVERRGGLAGSEQIWVVSHVVDGNRHYGAVRFPKKFMTGSSFPVLLYNHGGTNGVDMDGVFRQSVLSGCIRENFFVVLPSYRSEELRTSLLGKFQSEGQPSPLDRDVDDTIALLDAVLRYIPEADSEQVVAYGGSRGAGVTLLVAIRDRRIKTLVELYGPSDLLLPSLRQRVGTALNHDLETDSPFIARVIQDVVFPWTQGEISLAEARLKLIRASSAYFANRLPPLQIHHGARDLIISVAHGDRLASVLRGLGRDSPSLEYFRYPDGVHSRSSLPGSDERIEKFLCGSG